MKVPSPFVLDSDVFITAKNAYYAFDICPGFWKSILQAHEDYRIRSIDRIKDELLLGKKTEDLFVWVKDSLPINFFQSTQTEEVIAAYGEIMLWVQQSSQYFDRAKAKFATEADGWLVAYCMVHDSIVVTNEQPRPESRNRVLLPDVCSQFKVPFEGTFRMLRELSVKFDLR